MKNFNYPAPPPPPDPPAPEPKPEPTPETKPETKPEPAPEPKPEKTYTQAQLDAQKKAWEKDWQKKVADAEAKAKMTEDEKLRAERDDAVNQLKERDLRDSVMDAAKDAGVKNPKLFYSAYRDELEFDDKGKITNLKDVFESARNESPELFGSPKPSPEGGADAGEGKGKPSGGLTKEQIEKMSPKEIAENMEAVDKFLASQK